MFKAKAINTHYNGFFFRSRCEARWAVFFDKLGIEYVYEPEGFELKSGRYLPDFYLPKWRCWVEIKGENATPDERKKCRDLMMQDGRVVLLVNGYPGAEKMTLFLRYMDADNGDQGEIDLDCEWYWLKPENRVVLFCDDDYWYQNYIWMEAQNDWIGPTVVTCCTDTGVSGTPTSNPPTWAYSAAKSARFEFGGKA